MANRVNSRLAGCSAPADVAPNPSRFPPPYRLELRLAHLQCCCTLGICPGLGRLMETCVKSNSFYLDYVFLHSQEYHRLSEKESAKAVPRHLRGHPSKCRMTGVTSGRTCNGFSSATSGEDIDQAIPEASTAAEISVQEVSKLCPWVN